MRSYLQYTGPLASDPDGIVQEEYLSCWRSAPAAATAGAYRYASDSEPLQT